MSTQRDEEQKALMTLDDLMERIRGKLETAWEALPPDSEGARALADAWTDAQLMRSAHDQSEEMLRDAVHITQLMKQQRDMALQDRDFWMNENRDSGIQLVAFYLARTCYISIRDARLLIDQWIGDSDVPVSEYTKGEFVASVQQMAMEAMEEKMLSESAGDE